MSNQTPEYIVLLYSLMPGHESQNTIDRADAERIVSGTAMRWREGVSVWSIM